MNKQNISDEHSSCITMPKKCSRTITVHNFQLAFHSYLHVYQSQKAKAVMVLLEETNGLLPGRVLVLCRWTVARSRARRLGFATTF